MHDIADSDLALLLTNRVSALDVKPLTAREYWSLRRRTEVSSLEGLTLEEAVERDGDPELAERISALLSAQSEFVEARAQLEDEGVRIIGAHDEDYPQAFLERLGDGAPPALFVAGPVQWLHEALIGVVGSRAVDEQGAGVARHTALVARRVNAGIVSGGAKGVDLLSMSAAYDAEIPSVGVTAEGLRSAARRKDLRAAVAEGRLLLVSPFAPGAGFSVGGAMGRNKLIYALAVNTLVVASDLDSGGTWAGATEALRKGFGPVTVWSGTGSGPGNPALIRKGATPLDDLDAWEPLDVPARRRPPESSQLGFGI